MNCREIEFYYAAAKKNLWFYMFYLICRVSLAFAFVSAGTVKILGERFASGLSTLHPMGAYLEALHHTGYYYTFIGVVQILAGILLLFSRTVFIGALLYLPIIVNIWILSFALRFEGTFVTAPLMVMANLFILLWHCDKLKYLLPKKQEASSMKQALSFSRRFPVKFFLFVLLFVTGTITYAIFGHEVMPRNSMEDCQKQFESSEKESIGYTFCLCIHENGLPLEQCLKAYEEMSLKEK